MQRAADAEVQRVAQAISTSAAASRADGRPAMLQAALIAIDPRSGEVRALIGGRDFIQSNYNRAIHAQASAGLGVQAVRLRGGARGRLHAGDA